MGNRWIGAPGQSENEAAQFKIWVNRNYTLEFTKSVNAYKQHSVYLKTWPLCEETIGILPLCVFLISQCRHNQPNLWGVTRDSGWEWGFEFRKACRWTSSEECLWPSSAGDQKALLLLPTPHQALSRESERWLNFHTGSPHALGCQMWQITRVGILVWSSVHWVWADSSSSFNLSQKDLAPGAKGLNFCYWNVHLTYKPLKQGRPSC